MATVLHPGRLSPPRQVPAEIERPEYVGKKRPRTGEPDVKTPEIIERMRVAGKLAAQALAAVGAAVAPGVTTDYLDQVGHDFLVSHGAYPSTLGYRGYPKSLCTSLNEVICHGIPDDTLINDGDIVNIDITAFIGGVHGDTNATFCAGDVDEESRLLVERTHEAMMRGIRAVAPGRPLNAVGRVIESYARRFGYGVVRDFTGHGIGRTFHSGLIVPHYDDPHTNVIMEPGMTFTIEPMLTLGTIDYDIWPDGWTAVTKDRKRTAQFEHTILVTEDGHEILTLPVNGGFRVRRGQPGRRRRAPSELRGGADRPVERDRRRGERRVHAGHLRPGARAGHAVPRPDRGVRLLPAAGRGRAGRGQHVGDPQRPDHGVRRGGADPGRQGRRPGHGRLRPARRHGRRCRPGRSDARPAARTGWCSWTARRPPCRRPRSASASRSARSAWPASPSGSSSGPPNCPAGSAASPSGRPASEFWMRFADGREADLLSLPLLVDSTAPSVLELGAGSTTIQLTVHLRAHPAPGWLACRATTRFVSNGYHEEDFEVWDSAGTLVAQSRQLALILPS